MRVNEKGWTIPGIQDLNKVEAYNSNNEIIGGLLLQASSIAPMNIRGENDRQFANKILQYSINGKPFCYYASISQYYYNKATKIGAVSGIEAYVAYYDQDGDGIFEAMEPIPSLLIKWRPHLPDWVKKASQKQ